MAEPMMTMSMLFLRQGGKMMFLDTSSNREMLNLREPCLERTHLCDGDLQ